MVGENLDVNNVATSIPEYKKCGCRQMIIRTSKLNKFGLRPEKRCPFYHFDHSQDFIPLNVMRNLKDFLEISL